MLVADLTLTEPLKRWLEGCGMNGPLRVTQSGADVELQQAGGGDLFDAEEEDVRRLVREHRVEPLTDDTTFQA